jgi:UDP-N-acetylenolpyruvoylglucosamine reductase
MNVYENFSLSEILYYKIGGKARYVLKMQNYQDVVEALSFVKTNHISRILPVGLGANLLMSEDFLTVLFCVLQDRMYHSSTLQKIVSLKYLHHICLMM